MNGCCARNITFGSSVERVESPFQDSIIRSISLAWQEMFQPSPSLLCPFNAIIVSHRCFLSAFSYFFFPICIISASDNVFLITSMRHRSFPRSVHMRPQNNEPPPPPPFLPLQRLAGHIFRFTSTISLPYLLTVRLTNNGNSFFAGCRWPFSYVCSYRLIVYLLRWLVHNPPHTFRPTSPLSSRRVRKVAWRTSFQRRFHHLSARTTKIFPAYAQEVACLASHWEKGLFAAWPLLVQIHDRRISRPLTMPALGYRGLYL